MRYSALFASFALLAASCANQQQEQQENDVPGHGTTVAAAGGGQTDPVCEMERDATWTDYAVSGHDTTWFCSAHCKDVYSAAPEKYGKTTP